VNVAAMPKDLVESELFGIGRRIATGVDARAGKFEAASSGTLFLDEIGDMPIETQAKVLRALETREIVRVGEAEAIPVDIRLVSATSRDLAQRLTSGDFGLDLLHRINTVTVTMPPLRERRLDIAPLARRFLDKFAASQGKNGLSFSADALAILGNQPFPGNVRELKNLVERLASAAGHQQMIGRHEVLEALGPKLETTQAAQPPGESQTGSVLSQVPATHIPLETPKLGELADWLDQVRVDKNDPALRGIKPRLDAALQRLGQRLAGAALERCRDPNGHSLNRQSAMRYLMGDTTLNGKNPARLVNEILGRAQAQKVTEEDLEQLIALWSDGESHELP
jgi:transcriptional regulator with GAF, ATPase, and Fis domain